MSVIPEKPVEKSPTLHQIHLKEKFFSNNEYKLYKCLDEIILQIEGVDLFAKVRWEDVWSANKGDTHNRYRGFLRSRHIDFLILQSAKNAPYILIELNDKSHEREDRQIRDKRLTEYCSSTGLHLLWINTKPYYDQEEIRKQIRKCLESKEVVICKA